MLTVSYNVSREKWDEFLRDVKPHTFLQSWLWGEHQRETEGSIVRIGIAERGRLVAVALGIIVHARRGTFLLCPHGPIFRNSDFVGQSLSLIVGEFRKIAQENRCAFVRICPLLNNSAEHRELFKQMGFRPAPIHVHPEFSWRLRIDQDDQKLLDGMRKTTRYSIRKAHKDGVATEVSADPLLFESFWKLYRATVDRQRFVPFSKSSLETEFQIFAKEDNAFWALGKVNEKTVAMAMIVLGPDEAFYHHGASLHHQTASYDVQWTALCESRRRGRTWYNFWGVWPVARESNLSKYNHPQAGLSQFKRGFGGNEEAYVPTQDMPISSRYWFNVIVERARKLRRGF